MNAFHERTGMWASLKYNCDIVDYQHDYSSEMTKLELPQDLY